MSTLACLFERHRAALEGAVNRVLRDPDLTKDAIQHVLTSILSGETTLPKIPEPELVAWLTGACRRRAYTLYRQRRKERRQYVPVGAVLGVADTRPNWLEEALERLRLAERDWVRPLLPLACANLTTEQQRALVGIFYRGLTQEQVAIEEGVSPAAISGRYWRAIHALRRWFGITA